MPKKEPANIPYNRIVILIAKYPKINKNNAQIHNTIANIILLFIKNCQ